MRRNLQNQSVPMVVHRIASHVVSDCTLTNQFHHIIGSVSIGKCLARRSFEPELRPISSPRDQMRTPWWNGACHGSPWDSTDWDLSPCFEVTTLSLVPVLILAIFGGLEFPKLATRFKNDDNLPQKGGKPALATKLVSHNRLMLQLLA